MQIVTTIVPIFTVIFIGWIARKKGFVPSEFLGPANRLVYHLAIPAMVFRAVATAAFQSHFNPWVLGGLMGAVFLTFWASWALSGLGRFTGALRATFMQCSFHGNLGYIGLAVAYYFLGDDGLAHASILTGFEMIFHNFLAIVILSIYGEGQNAARTPWETVCTVLGNPVILSAIFGILFSLLQLPLPPVADRSLDILGSLALPLALLLIGASLSPERMRERIGPIIGASFLKLMVMPAMGFWAYIWWGLPPAVYLPGLILLACPPATVIYVMSRELGGDSDLAVAAISGSTLFSALTIAFWLHVGLG